MISLHGATLAFLLAWGTAVGVDLVSWPQAMISRPLIAGAVTAALMGDLEGGLRVALVMELFALDVLPVGASRYPDYGPATVGAVALRRGSAVAGGTGARGAGGAARRGAGRLEPAMDPGRQRSLDPAQRRRARRGRDQ